MIGRVRPDCRAAPRPPCSPGCSSAPRDGAGEPVHLHGDANLRNALLDGGRIALVDLEDAAAGPGRRRPRVRARRAARRAGAGAARPRPSRTRSARRCCAATRRSRRSPDARRAALAHRRLGARARRRARGRPRAARPCSPACEPLLRAAEELRRMSRPPLLCYCQHSVGLGHLMRSYALCAALSERFRVVLRVRRRAARRASGRRAGVQVLALPPLGVGAGGRLRQPRPALHGRAGVGGARASGSSRRSAPCGRPPCSSSCSRSGGRSSRASSCRCSRPRGRRARSPPAACATSSSRAAPTSRPSTTAPPRSPTPTSTRCSSTAIPASRGWRRRSRRARPLRVPVHYTGFVVRDAAPAAPPRGEPRRRVGRRRARGGAAAARRRRGPARDRACRCG